MNCSLLNLKKRIKSQIEFNLSRFPFERYDRKSGEKYQGNTTFLFEQNDDQFHLLLDENGDINWITFSNMESKSCLPFYKDIHPGDDSISYLM